MGKLQVVVGGQYGSEGKGAIAAYLSRAEEHGGGEVAAVRVAGPNAGHSAVDDQGNKWALRQIPVAAVVNPDAHLVIAAGSEIDEEVLADEITRLQNAGFKIWDRLFIDGQATVITDDAKAEEIRGEMHERIGSTAKGIGAARAKRIMREAPLWHFDHDEDTKTYPVNTLGMLNRWMDGGASVVIEGTQGYGLGLHAGFYPQCTSSDCRAVDFLSMVGISPWAPWVPILEPWVVLRTYPIRVAGNSGPMYDELSWVELEKISGGHIKPEYTTVTQKMRRVGSWDPELAIKAVQANGGAACHVALTFFDYWFPELYEVTQRTMLSDVHIKTIREVEHLINAPVMLLGTGPNSVIDLR